MTSADALQTNILAWLTPLAADFSGISLLGSRFGRAGLPTRAMPQLAARPSRTAAQLLRRHRAPTALPPATYSLVGPDGLTGPQLATIWGEALGRPVRYGGDDLVAMEQRMKGMIPSWHAMDLRLMLSRYQSEGAVASPTDLALLTALLGRAPRSYRAFAKEAAAQWTGG